MKLARRLLILAVLAARPLCAQTAPPTAPSTLPPPLDLSITHVTTGGVWRSHGAHGWYRLIVFSSGPEHVNSRLLIQWIEENQAGERLVVREAREISVIADPWSLGAPEFVPVNRGAKAMVPGTNTQSGHTARWVLTLGPPGQFGFSPVR